MSSTEATSASTSSPMDAFLEAYEREHQITMRVLQAYPTEQLDLRPHAKSKTARELAWIFVLERGLGTRVWNHELQQMMAAGAPPPPPERWDELLAALEHAHREFADVLRATPAERLDEPVQFFVAPRTMGDIPRMEWLWFLLHDQIHHRGQFSIYLRMADGKVPSIYGPSGDEPWM